MKIAFIGIRGIPVIYSAFETFAEQLATELTSRGYRITVYCRSPYVDTKKTEYRGVRLVTLPTIKSKNFETFIHSLISTLHACFFRRYEVIYYFGVGNALFTFFPRLLGINTIINVDGLDWKREKWGWFAKRYLKFSEYIATEFATVIITDSPFIKDYYLENYKKETIYIPYSFNKYSFDAKETKRVLNKYDLKKEKYFIWVGRIVPENHLEDLLVAFKKLKSSMRCVVAGDDLYESSYKNQILKMVKEDRRVIFTGFIKRKEVHILEENCFAYIETKRSGGTHQSLVEALGMGCFIIAVDHVANRQILGSSVVYYNLNRGSENLSERLKEVIKSSFSTDIIRVNAKKIFKKNFNTVKIIKRYKELLTGMK